MGFSVWERFFPDMRYESVYEIPYKDLLAKNKTAIVFDVDNTLAPYFVPRPPVKVTALLSRLKKMGFKLCLLSNNKGGRLSAFNEQIGLPAVHMALKPLSFGMKRAMRLMDAKPENTVLIGDQIFSDVWCGKRTGVMTILTKPISDKEALSVRIKRRLERPVLRAYRNKNEV
ncbi:MAG: YqeG family HAD IIIA-type phosphatase [Defluviitaleaceae bacterium]|nr:YqeG family HAD IIIA-type phosphatase [Defluviitaleaceae bacterium]